jgi:hypothetical protein
MPIRLDILADDDLRKQLLELCRQQLRPLHAEAVKNSLPSKEWFEEQIRKEVAAYFKASDVGTFVRDLKAEILRTEAYQESYKLLPDEVRRDAKALASKMMEEFMLHRERTQVEAIVKDILKKVASS